MQNQTSIGTTLDAATQTRSLSKPLQIICAFILGGVILYGAGFINAAAVHNAAHDIRHSQGFPCH